MVEPKLSGPKPFHLKLGYSCYAGRLALTVSFRDPAEFKAKWLFFELDDE